MNTVLKGNTFEDVSYEIIINAIENEEFGLSKKWVRVFKKKGYYSRDREKDIIFDLSIEVWPPNSNRYTLLYLFECKSSSVKRVPVDDIEEFYAKIQQVSGANAKGVMITDNSFQEGAFNFGKNKGLMLIEVNDESTYEIILHKVEKRILESYESQIEYKILKLLNRAVLSIKSAPKIVNGLKKLSASNINDIASKIISKYCTETYIVETPQLIKHLEVDYNVSFRIEKSLVSKTGESLLGYYNCNKSTVFINESIVNTKRFRFVLGHELGHFFLHRNIMINQEIYENFEDSEYNLFTDRHELKNERHWIEWQANKFSNSFILPERLFIIHLYYYRKLLGIPRYNHVYVDHQEINKIDFYKTVKYLSDFFMTTQKSVIYRLEDLNLVTYGEGGKSDIRSLIRKLLIE